MEVDMNFFLADLVEKGYLVTFYRLRNGFNVVVIKDDNGKIASRAGSMRDISLALESAYNRLTETDERLSKLWRTQ